MSFWDDIKKFTQPYADDEYEDEYEDDVTEGFEEEAEPEVRSNRRRRPAFGFSTKNDTEIEDTASDYTEPAAAKEPSTERFSGQVINISGNPKLALHHITVFKDSSVPADDLRKRKAVIVNMENVDKATARRIVDFLSGCIYAIGGKVKKVSQATYLFSPSNVEVEGDLDTKESEVESYV